MKPNKKKVFLIALLLAVSVTVSGIGSSKFKGQNRSSVDAMTSAQSLGETMQKQDNEAIDLSAESAVNAMLVEQFELLLSQQLPNSKQPNEFLDVTVESSQETDKTAVGKYQGNYFLQAPHRFSDINSGQIAEQVLQTSHQVNAYFSNLLHRRDFDFSTQNPSILIDLTLAYLRHYPRATVVQLHGYAREKRKSPVAQKSNFIISTGSRRITALASSFGACLERAGFDGVAVFGRGVNELGATTNVVKKAMYKLQYSRFLHVEMSYQQRQAFVESPQLVQVLATCLDEVVQ